MAEHSHPRYLLRRWQHITLHTGSLKLTHRIRTPAPRRGCKPGIIVGREQTIESISRPQPPEIVAIPRVSHHTVIPTAPPHRQKRPRPPQSCGTGRGCIVTATERKRKVVLGIVEV